MNDTFNETYSVNEMQKWKESRQQKIFTHQKLLVLLAWRIAQCIFVLIGRQIFRTEWTNGESCFWSNRNVTWSYGREMCRWNEICCYKCLKFGRRKEWIREKKDEIPWQIMYCTFKIKMVESKSQFMMSSWKCVCSFVWELFVLLITEYAQWK